MSGWEGLIGTSNEQEKDEQGRAGRYGLKTESLIFSHQTLFTISIFDHFFPSKKKKKTWDDEEIALHLF